MPPVMALRASGRLKVRAALDPSCATRTSSAAGAFMNRCYHRRVILLEEDTMLRTLLAVSLLAVSTLGFAQKYPSRTVEVVVPYAPGGGTDNLMRTITA